MFVLAFDPGMPAALHIIAMFADDDVHRDAHCATERRDENGEIVAITSAATKRFTRATPPIAIVGIGDVPKYTESELLSKPTRDSVGARMIRRECPWWTSFNEMLDVFGADVLSDGYASVDDGQSDAPTLVVTARTHCL